MRRRDSCLLGRWDSIAINIAIVLGVGIFIVPSEVAKYLSSSYLVMSAWILGGMISLLGAFCYAELSSSFPKTGGNYIYLRESYGPLIGFLFGWTELLVIRTGSIAAVSFIFAEYLKSFLSIESNFLVKPIAISAILALSIINIIGLQYSRRIQNTSVVTKILIITGIIAFGILFKKGDLCHFQFASAAIEKRIFPAFGLALIPILWTYGGWHENTFMAEETKDAGKTIPFALVTGTLIITALYLVINFLYIYLIPHSEMANEALVVSKVLEILLGQNGRKLFDILIMVSALGCLSATILTGSRITYAMAQDNVIFKFIGKIDRRYGTPVRAIVINAIWSMVLILLGTFNKLLFFTGIVVWLFFALAAGGLFILRRKFPDIERPYKAWGYPSIPIIFILVCAALVLNTLIHYPFQSIAGLCLTMTGIPLFILSQKKKIFLYNDR